MTTGEECPAQFLIASRHPATWFHLRDESLHLFPSLIVLRVIDHGLRSMPLGRDDGRHLPLPQALAHPIALRALGHDDRGQVGPYRALVQDGVKDRRSMAGAAGQVKCHTGLFVKTAGVPLGGEPTPRASPSLCRVPTVVFRAPAAG